MDTKGWYEEDREERRVKNFAAVCDEQGGLAVFTKGLNEAAVQDNRSRSIAVTLLRSFRELLQGQTTMDSQLLGTHTVEYAIAPFSMTRTLEADLMAEAERYKIKLASYTHLSTRGADAALVSELGEPNAIDPQEHEPLRKILAGRPALVRELPRDHSFVELYGPIALSTIKVSEDGGAVIVRLWNPLPRKATAKLSLNFSCSGASVCDMMEKPTGELAVTAKGKVTLNIAAKKIVTLRFETNE